MEIVGFALKLDQFLYETSNFSALEKIYVVTDKCVILVNKSEIAEKYSQMWNTRRQIS